LIGVVAGVLLALAAGRLVAAMLFGIGASDPWTLGGVSIALLVSAAAAAVIPAWRAARVDPVTALRAE
jgi:ABC-type antimicrobial peptide transport system permease subunit